MTKIGLIAAAWIFCGSAFATGKVATIGNDLLVKMAPTAKSARLNTLQTRLPEGAQIEDLGVAGWMHVKMPANKAFNASIFSNMPGVLAVKPNRVIQLSTPWTVRDPKMVASLKAQLALKGIGDQPPPDNPQIPTTGSGGSGADPLTMKQWGMNQNRVHDAWSVSKGAEDVVVAVIDTGVDYTHEDLVDNIWHNAGEMGTDANGKDKASNGVDDDGNGYIDDVIGWDFADKDNKPYDFTASLTDILFGGGNPGHGTHCAGNVAARADNGKGVTGVAPGVRIMPLRFITVKGQGTTADAVLAIKYASDNGARVLSNSWGSEGDEGDADATALKDAINYAMGKGVLFVAAAGNGHQGVGYDNDTDSKPGVPASYDIENIISVAAIDEAGALGSFSNWGVKSVDLGAPGVKVFSTVTQSEHYSDTVIDFGGITATWDGTSMATPHVAGAAALYLSIHPDKTWKDAKDAILGSVKKNPALNGKTVSGGQLDVYALSQF
jgi:subtilisin family serine protease